MHIILTHEQADFDALASLFGASVADERGLPVLPRKLNRNARAFVSLYGADLPFVDPRDIPHEAVETVTLVDTQSLVTVKGMGKHTPVRAVDHHNRRDSTPAEWDLTEVETGATTTHFVEILEGRDEALSTVQATLLLLGIYEDTGSLTYSHTTARDIRAAAWLLDSGASLQVAAGYLNPPLSDDQRGAYDTLVNAAEAREIDGLRVVIAKADLPGLTDEISSLAHKLRDLFDPDALFLLVQTGEGVRMVARSTADRVDVSAVAGQFGGGGHERAASAVIKRKPPLSIGGASVLEDAAAELLEVLPHHIRPAVTVAQLMSRKPRTLAPDTGVGEAAKLMQKYGYEGFPVAHDGHVVGLLTRRAVDRAISHRLNLTAASLMEAGEVAVRPNDSLQHLQTVMVESGWGQVPVIDADSKVIGIVTRTDLLKVLAPPAAQMGRQSLRASLENELPAEQRALLHAVAKQAADLHLAVYIVGGFVRDLLLGRPSLDIDIVVEGDAMSLARALAKKHGGRVTAHARFGTAKWFIESSPLAAPESRKAQAADAHLPAFIDLITARLEFYEHPGALPGVEHGSIRHDLHRRDFTINTLAVRLDGHHFGELHDYYGGHADLQRGLVRVLHSLSCVDDPTRMLRAVRYEQRYGFAIESRTLQLMDEARPLMTRLSAERVRHELDLFFDEPRAAAMLARLDELGLLKSILDVLPWSGALHARLETGLRESPPPEWGRFPPPSAVSLNQALGYALWLQDLTPAQVDSVHARLGFPLALHRVIRGAAALRVDLPLLTGATPSAWTFRLDELPLFSIFAVFVALGESEGDSAALGALENYALRWRHIQTATNGDTLVEFGLPPGPRYQTILNRLRAAWLDGEVNSADQEQRLLRELIAAEYGPETERQ
jgi:tRNA nucleotidyltransferase (CCA-adding enzyme)